MIHIVHLCTHVDQNDNWRRWQMKRR